VVDDWRAGRARTIRRAAAVRSRGDGPRLTTVVLDLGGVVVPTLFEVVDEPGFPAGPFGDDPLYEGVEQGRMQERDYWAELARCRPDIDIGRYMRTRLGVRAEIRTLLARIGGRVRVVALTNDMAHWFGADWATSFAELDRFDLLLEATRSGVLKPDPAVFRWALRLVREPADRCLFVDDLPSNLRGAQAVGMAVEHFRVDDPAGSVRRVLDRLGIDGDESPSRTYHPERA
jgi:putative hydrolase of the HAD superfamily